MTRYKLLQIEKECRRYAGMSFCNWLQSSYLGWGMSCRLLGEMLGVSRQAVSDWLKYYNIDARERGEMTSIRSMGEDDVA